MARLIFEELDSGLSDFLMPERMRKAGDFIEFMLLVYSFMNELAHYNPKLRWMKVFFLWSNGVKENKKEVSIRLQVFRISLQSILKSSLFENRASIGLYRVNLWFNNISRVKKKKIVRHKFNHSKCDRSINRIYQVFV